MFKVLLVVYLLFTAAKGRKSSPTHDIVLKTIKCSSTQNYLSPEGKCWIENENGRTGASYDWTVTKNVSTVNIHALFYTERLGVQHLLMDLKNIDFCECLKDSSKSGTSRIVKMFMDMAAAGGKLPEKCPIIENSKVLFNKLNIDAGSFPFLPEMGFRLVLLFTLNGDANAFSVDLTGEVVNLRKTLLMKI
ncbi:hypothetical protein ACFFRR_004405 [Megaselia abdita]